MNQYSCINNFLKLVQKKPNSFAYHSKKNNSWHSVSWKELGEKVENFSKGLIAIGHISREPIAILSYNNPEWYMGCVATQLINGISVGIYTTSSEEEVEYVLNHSKASILILENKNHWDKQVKPILKKLQYLKNVIFINNNDFNEDKQDIVNITSFEEVATVGSKEDNFYLLEREKEINHDDVAVYIYTSGTTGPPKAVMLSHRAIKWSVNSCIDLLRVKKEDKLVSYLPLAHIAEQMFTIYTSITGGMSIYFAESMEKLPNNIKEVQPSVFFGVPRVYEKFYEKVKEKLEKEKGIKKFILNWGRNVSSEFWNYSNKSIKAPISLRIQYALAKKAIFNKIKNMMGFGNIRICVSGAAPISKDIIDFFASLDLPIYEVYGQSEDCGPTSFNSPGRTKIGTVGKPIPGLTVRIAKDGEILVRAPSVFNGYLKNEKETESALKKGWLFSGDIGEIDADGFLKITDRKKDLIITAGGKNIAPQYIEKMLRKIDLICSAVIIGDGKKYLCALLTPNFEKVILFSKKNNIEYNNASDLAKNEKIIAEIQSRINEINKKLAPVEQIKKFRIINREFSIEENELTPTMKIKRKIVNEKFQKEIISMYEN